MDYKDIEAITDSRERDEQLMLVYAVEGYAKRHNLDEKDTLELFTRYNIVQALHDCYSVLHTQDLDENVYFAEDIIRGGDK